MIDVLYDYQIFSAQRYGGISRYFHELIACSNHLFSADIAVKYHINNYLHEVVESSPYPKNYGKHISSFSFPGKNLLSSFLRTSYRNRLKVIESDNREFVKEKFKYTSPDIFHPTYYSDYFFDFIGNTPFVITIYDMIHEIFPEYFLKDPETPQMKRKLFLSADHIIAISNTTKEDIMRFYGVSDAKISVVHLANTFVKKECKAVVNERLPERYILYVGNRGRFKNFWFFLTSISELLKNDNDLCVICVGVPFNAIETKYIGYLRLTDKVLHRNAGEDELSQIYSRALALALPSLYEGFGIPAIEAFACGCPALLSNASALEEIGGDAAAYFEPKSPQEIKNTVANVLYDSDLRKKLILKGYERLNHFSWKKTAEQTAKIYEMCL